MDTKDKQLKAQFERELHEALQNIYDPVDLGRSPLVELLNASHRQDPTAALRNTLIQGIEGLKPEPDVPPQADAWRVYHILRQRYVEQFCQSDIAANLAVSTRQLRRLQIRALRALADHLWARYNLAQRAPGLVSGATWNSEATLAPATPTGEQEMEWLRESLPSEPASVAELIRSAIAVADPLLHALRVEAGCGFTAALPSVAVPVTPVRHALLSILAAAAHSAAGGSIVVEAGRSPGQVWVRIRTIPKHPCVPSTLSEDQVDKLEMARRLIEVAGGSLELPQVGERKPFATTLSLPSPEMVTVLVVDDNADALQLLERYLGGTRYHFVGVRDPWEALALVDDSSPQIVILDLMLPRMDGWELLGRFREHPKTRHVPVIVCSILPQEDLALTLGAAALIRKPVSRAALLAALDKQTVLLPKESR